MWFLCYYGYYKEVNVAGLCDSSLGFLTPNAYNAVIGFVLRQTYMLSANLILI